MRLVTPVKENVCWIRSALIYQYKQKVETEKHLQSCRISPSFDYDCDPVFFMSLVDNLSKKPLLKKKAVVISETLATCRHSKATSTSSFMKLSAKRQSQAFVTKFTTKEISI